MATWRRIGSPIVLVILLFGLALGVWWGYKQLFRPIDPKPVQACTTQAASKLAAAQVKVEVLNTGETAGRAAQITDQLAAVGFQTDSPGNSSPAVAKTTVVAGKADSAEAKLVMGFFPESVSTADDRTTGSVTVLVGDNFAGFNADAAKEIDVPAGEICIQLTPTPSPSEATIQAPAETPA